MNRDQLQRANVKNLTNLWKIMGAGYCTMDSGRTLNFSTAWPHRAWYDWECTPDAGDIDILVRASNEFEQSYVIPVWDGKHAKLNKGLRLYGFKPVFTQKAMVLNVNSARYHPANTIRIRKVLTDSDIDMWTEVASRSFGYSIHPHVIRRISKHAGLHLFMAEVERKPVATVLLYEDSRVAGIHQFGVLPEYRELGIARRFMAKVLNKVHVQNKFNYVTLQASVMGEKLYRQMGFMEQFTITNFR